MADVINHATLPTNLVSYWELEEASGTRLDSHGTNDLSDINTVTQTTGKQGNAANFVKAQSEYLQISDALQTGLDITGDMSFSMWIKTTAFQTGFLIAKWHHVSYTSYMFYLSGASNLEFYINASPSGYGYTGTWWAHGMTAGSWNHIALRYTASAGSCEVFINGVSIGNKTGLANSIANSAAIFMLGNRQNPANYLDGQLDEVGVWNKSLTNSEITDLYNSGAGIPYDAGGGGGGTPTANANFFGGGI